MKDRETSKSRGFAFVTFLNRRRPRHEPQIRTLSGGAGRGALPPGAGRPTKAATSGISTCGLLGTPMPLKRGPPQRRAGPPPKRAAPSGPARSDAGIRGRAPGTRGRDGYGGPRRRELPPPRPVPGSAQRELLAPGELPESPGLHLLRLWPLERPRAMNALPGDERNYVEHTSSGSYRDPFDSYGDPRGAGPARGPPPSYGRRVRGLLARRLWRPRQLPRRACVQAGARATAFCGTKLSDSERVLQQLGPPQGASQGQRPSGKPGVGTEPTGVGTGTEESISW